MMKKYNSKNSNAEKVTRTITIYRIVWNAMDMDTHEIVKKFKDMSCKVDDNDLFEFVSCLYRDKETDTNMFPMVRGNDDVTIETIEFKRQMSMRDFIEHSVIVNE